MTTATEMLARKLLLQIGVWSRVEVPRKVVEVWLTIRELSNQRPDTETVIRDFRRYPLGRSAIQVPRAPLIGVSALGGQAGQKP
jgi:hypothetical protein